MGDFPEEMEVLGEIIIKVEVGIEETDIGIGDNMLTLMIHM